MTALSTFTSFIKADLTEPVDGRGKRSVLVIGVAVEDLAAPAAGAAGAGAERLNFVVVDHDGRGRLVPATGLTFTDDAVLPPKYG